jgi:glycosyltransferase involved in cell wall biosynthesis
MNLSPTQKFRVLLVTARYFPYMGGIETHVHEVGRRLVQRGLDVTILTTMPHTSHTSAHALPREARSEGMRVLRVPALLEQRGELYIAPVIYPLVQYGGWDIVHCQGIHTCVPPIAMLAASRARIPFLVTMHTDGHSSRLRNMVRSTQWRTLRPLLAQAERLIGVSQFETHYFRTLLHLPAEHFTCIPNGATLPAVSSTLYTPPPGTLIVSVGRLERYKGHQHIISALPRIREERPDARMLILGAGPYEATLRALAQRLGVAEHVEIRAIPGGDRKAMAALLSQASLVTLMSEYEAHPIAVMEALALQRPVLGLQAAGLQELAEQGLIRTVPLKSSPDDIAAAALLQMDAPLATSHVTLPDWDECAERLLAVYESLCPDLCARLV